MRNSRAKRQRASADSSTAAQLPKFGAYRGHRQVTTGKNCIGESFEEVTSHIIISARRVPHRQRWPDW